MRRAGDQVVVEPLHLRDDQRQSAVTRERVNALRGRIGYYPRSGAKLTLPDEECCNAGRKKKVAPERHPPRGHDYWIVDQTFRTSAACGPFCP